MNLPRSKRANAREHWQLGPQIRNPTGLYRLESAPVQEPIGARRTLRGTEPPPAPDGAPAERPSLESEFEPPLTVAPPGPSK